MPIEIRELVIRARVDPEGEPCCGAEMPPSARDSGRDSGRHDEMVAACVRQVLQILEDKRER